MKTPLLLNVLQTFATKANLNYKKTASKKGDGGFTILELLIIVILVGIFASIAAPGWLAFINRQRVRTVNDRVFQSLRLAQSEAKRTKRDITVTFNYDLNAPGVADPPTVKFTPPLATSDNMQTLANGDRVQRLDGGGEIKAGTIALSTNATVPVAPGVPLHSIVFDYQGNVENLPPSPPSPNGRFVVSVSTVKGAAKQCAIVETIIGGMRTAQGNDCPTLP